MMIMQKEQKILTRAEKTRQDIFGKIIVAK